MNSVSTPNGKQHHKIVALENFFLPTPVFKLPSPHTYELQEHKWTPKSQIVERIKDANVVVLSTAPLPAEVLAEQVTPNLKMVAVVASGIDSVDLEACRKRGIVVSNTPNCNTTAVSEHAIGLYLAVRRSIPRMHQLTQAGEWPKQVMIKSMFGPDGESPRTCRDEVVGIMGYGGVGRKIAALAKNMGMKVVISGRKGAPAKDDRPSFDEVIRTATVVILCLPRTAETIDYISTPEFEAMQRHAVLVNVSRGGVVNEEAMVRALEENQIAGAATDVFVKEPASPETCPLLGPRTQGLNLVTTPHVAWLAEETNKNYLDTLETNVAAFVSGKPVNDVTRPLGHSQSVF